MIKNNIKGNRTLNTTVEDLLCSKRFEIAVNNFKDDPMFMKAILIELGQEAMNVSKNAVIRCYGMHSSLDAFELKPLLRNLSDFDTYNIFWSLSPLEQKLYMADPKAKLTAEERTELLERLKTEFMGG